ncbi:hypothetical protein GLOTRDRAFT_80829 [Gloeophyllum trabeum ATCC 11539]|uniref:Complex 1 LYR protein domain-containing protein n=1 Tax=Gloeophyllum trabeum (strain ATCC 11539 / FP-39264 / Madison 617) TaxID=670483 RepID=S7RC65_GLOTA|nr:uncharacterized protein GLOTRDRAFT_80829 [Gloeophyllum trabeum ATCC 11539]EPQ51830.1 hypothetical protein GLOTRDRAFT_80829 [Gloeophyllum trabeum ATCC 11539]
MSTPPTRNAILNLYASTLRASRAFSSYNFRNYFIRRTKDTFRQIQNEQDPQKLTSFYNEARKELAVLKRSAVVNQLYGGWRLVVEKQKPERERGNN